jgi:hypothetical protein
VNVNLYGKHKRVFTDVIKNPGLCGKALNTIIYTEKEKTTWPCRQRLDWCCHQPRKYWWPPETERRKGFFPRDPGGGGSSYDHPLFQPSDIAYLFCGTEVWTQGLALAKQALYNLNHAPSPKISVVLKNQVCANCFRIHRKLIKWVIHVYIKPGCLYGVTSKEKLNPIAERPFSFERQVNT